MWYVQIKEHSRLYYSTLHICIILFLHYILQYGDILYKYLNRLSYGNSFNFAGILFTNQTYSTASDLNKLNTKCSLFIDGKWTLINELYMHYRFKFVHDYLHFKQEVQRKKMKKSEPPYKSIS